jgi:DNA repair protein RadC
VRVRELTIVYRPHPSGVEIDGRSATDPQAAAAVLVPVLGPEAVEVFALLLLDARSRVLAYHEVARGSLDAAAFSPASIFRAALLANAHRIILAHNHPSGDPTPSPEDRYLTRRLIAGGALVGVEVIDHLIVGDDRYYSLKAHGQL